MMKTAVAVVVSGVVVGKLAVGRQVVVVAAVSAVAC